MSAVSVLGQESPSYPGQAMAVLAQNPTGAGTDPCRSPGREMGRSRPLSAHPGGWHRPSHPGSRHRPPPPTPPVGRALSPAQLRGREPAATAPVRSGPIRAALTGWNCSSMSARGRPPACGEREGG